MSPPPSDAMEASVVEARRLHISARLRWWLLLGCALMSGSALLSGWVPGVMGFRAVLPGEAELHPGSTTILLSLSVLLLIDARKPVGHLWMKVLAVLTLLATAAAVIARVLAPVVSIFPWNPPPPATSITLFLLTGAGTLALLQSRSWRLIGVMGIGALTFPLIRLVIWLLQPHPGQPEGLLDGMALHTALISTTVAWAGIILHPSVPFVKLLTEQSMVGKSLRRGLGVALLGPVLISAVLMASQTQVNLALRDALALTAVAGSLGLACMLLFGLRMLAETHQLALERERQLARNVEEMEAAATRERFLRTIADGLPGLIAYWDTQLRCRFSNRAFQDWYGRSVSSVLGGHAADVLGPGSYAAAEPLMRRALEGEEQRFEHSLSRNDGASGHVLSHFIPDRVGDEVRGFFALATDITELRAREDELLRLYDNLERLVEERTAQLRASAERFSQLFEQSPVGHLLVARDGQIRSANASLGAIFGWTGSELIGKPMEILLPEGLQAPPPHEAGRRQLAAGREVVGVHRDGSRRALEVGLMPLTLDGEHLVLASVVDISDRERAQREIALLAAVVRASADAVITTTPDGTINSWNPGAERLFGYSTEFAVGRSTLMLTTPDLRREDRILMQRVAEGETVRELDSQRLHRDGSLLDVSLTLWPLRDRSGRIVGASLIARDISQRKRMERMLDQHSRELERSNLALEQFTWAASHDLQEPLRMVVSYLQLIERRYRERLDEAGLEMMDFAVDGARRMQALVNGLLAFARLRPAAGDAQASLSACLDQALKLLDGRIGAENAQLQRPAAGDDANVRVEPAALTQLWQNLIQNALKYRAEATPRITISWRRVGGEVQCTVSDNGVGIAPRYHERIFQIFARLDAGSRDGTGIGLALCKRVVEGAGGRIWVESDGQSGSRFHFQLPLADSPQRA